MKHGWPRALARAGIITAASTLVLWLLHRLGVGLPLLAVLAMGAGLVAGLLPRWGSSLLDSAILFVRSRLWASESGQHHSFAGVALYIVDDGRQVWIGGDGLQRALGRREPDDVLAARHAGNWRRNADGALLLRVEAAVQVLATMPGRDEPRVLRLRRYLERDVIYPAQQRRQRA